MTKPEVDLSLKALFQMMWKNRRLFIIVSVITIVLSAVISLLLTEYYKSTVVIFPARTSTLTLNESGVKRGNISDFGEEQEAEQLLQIINSEELQIKVIEENDLYEHYEIERSEPHARSKIRQTYNSNITAKRTKYNSIDISVIDKDPVKASEIANSISDYTDTVKNDMIRERARTSMNMVQAERQRLTRELTKVSGILDSLQTLGVVSEVERAALRESLGRAYGRVSERKINELEQQLKTNQKHAEAYDAKRRQREILVDQLQRFRSVENQLQADAAIDIPQKFTVDRAVPADKKSFPIRWLIVAGSLASVLFFTLILLIMRDQYAEFFGEETA